MTAWEKTDDGSQLVRHLSLTKRQYEKHLPVFMAWCNECGYEFIGDGQLSKATVELVNQK